MNSDKVSSMRDLGILANGKNGLLWQIDEVSYGNQH